MREGRAEVGLDLGLLAAAGAIGEGEVGEVARQPDPRAHHDVALGAGAAQPLAGRFRQVVESHAWGSFGRSRSRSRAASSYSSRAIASRSRVRSRSRSMAPSRRRAALPTCRVAPWKRCKQRHQSLGEDPVVLGAAQPAAGPEFHELDAAIGTGHLGQLADQLADVGHDQALDDRVERQVGR